MKIIKIRQQEDWLKYLDEYNENEHFADFDEFLQSWSYGEFLKTIGRQVERLAFVDEKNNESMLVQYLVNKTVFKIPYVYFPRLYLKEKFLYTFLDYFQKQNFVFLRLELANKINLPTRFKTTKTKNLQPPYTWVLDLSLNNDLLLANMHAKTRYNIRLAERNRLKLKREKDLDVFYNLMSMTAKRNNFVNHQREFFAKLLNLNTVYQFTVYKDEIPLATALCLRNNNVFTYLFGASNNEYRNLMAPYLLHWQIIKFAKENLYLRYYDWWGIAPPVKDDNGQCFHHYCWQANHPLSGVSRFKAGFGGQLRSYPQSFELILKPLIYKIYKLRVSLGQQKIVGHPLN